MPWAKQSITIKGESVEAMAKVSYENGTGSVELPFDDELRSVPLPDEVPPAPDLDRSMSTLVNALQARCVPGGPVDVDAGVPNYALRSQHAALEAFALGLDDSAVQKVKMRAEALRPSRADTEFCLLYTSPSPRDRG